MTAPTTTITALPHALPACPNARVALFALRRMGAHGLHDARASHALSPRSAKASVDRWCSCAR